MPRIARNPSSDVTVMPSLVALMVGSTPDQHMTHTIMAPLHVRLDQTWEGANEALQIESAGETTTLVRLRLPALPDLVPGTIIE